MPSRLVGVRRAIASNAASSRASASRASGQSQFSLPGIVAKRDHSARADSHSRYSGTMGSASLATGVAWTANGKRPAGAAVSRLRRDSLFVMFSFLIVEAFDGHCQCRTGAGVFETFDEKGRMFFLRRGLALHPHPDINCRRGKRRQAHPRHRKPTSPKVGSSRKECGLSSSGFRRPRTSCPKNSVSVKPLGAAECRCRPPAPQNGHQRRVFMFASCWACSRQLSRSLSRSDIRLSFA